MDSILDIEKYFCINKTIHCFRYHRNFSLTEEVNTEQHFIIIFQFVKLKIIWTHPCLADSTRTRFSIAASLLRWELQSNNGIL